MEVSQILAEINREIERLQQVRALLADETPVVRRGRKPGSKNAVKKRKLSPEGRRRIAEAMKRRWAERRGATAKATKA